VPTAREFEELCTICNTAAGLSGGLLQYTALNPDHEAHIDVLIAARHAITILWAAGVQRNGGMSPQDLAGYIGYRIREVERPLG